MNLSIRCSKLARPMSCAGSLFFKDLLEEPPGDAAKEGTAAGEYLERLLTGQPIPTHARNGVQFDEDMIMYAQETAAKIKSLADSVSCEQKIDWKTRSGITITGTYDISFVVGDTLYIDDYKYGWGIVEAKDNWQLIGYAVGQVERIGKWFDNIVLRIHQPRPHHEEGTTREWRITGDELLVLREKIESRMEAIAAGDKTLVTGDHCRYCPAAGGACPAFNKAFFRGVEVAHSFIQDTLSDEELSFQLDLVDRVAELIKNRQGSLTALAVDRIKNGSIIPNYVSEPRLGDRKWKPSITPQFIKAMTGKDVIEHVMLSPAKAEKIGVPKELVASLVERPVLGSKLKKVDTKELGNKTFGKPKTIKGESNANK